MDKSASVEKKKRLIINAAYYVLIIGAFYLFMKYAFWWLFPFLLAFFVAIILQKPINAIVRKTPLKKGLVSTVIVLFGITIVLFLIGLVGTKAFAEIKGFANYIFTIFEDLPSFLEIAKAKCVEFCAVLPDSIENVANQGINSLFDKLATSLSSDVAEVGSEAAVDGGFSLSWLATPLSGVISTARQIPSILISVVVAIIACCFMTADYTRITTFIKNQMPETKRGALSRTKTLTFQTMGKMCRAYCIIILITFTEMTIGLSVLKLIGVYSGKYLFIIAPVVAIVDILPILGTGTILIPWGIVSLFMGNVGMGVGVLVIYAAISVIRQVLEPKLVAGQLGLPPIVTLIGMYFGLRLIGVIGMFIIPLMLTVLKVLNDDGIVHIWNNPNAQKVETIPILKRKVKIQETKDQDQQGGNDSCQK